MVLLLVPTTYEFEILFNEIDKGSLSSSCLHEFEVEGSPVMAGVCGFGLAAAGVQSMDFIRQVSGDKSSLTRVILLGICGSYHESLVPGSALWGSEVRCAGIGVGQGDSLLSPETLGWEQLPGKESSQLPLRKPENLGLAASGTILSVAAASGSADQADYYLQQHPAALVEEMEGFSVALACQLAGVPLSILRGVSNFAGQREKKDWKVKESLGAVRELLIDELEEVS